MLNILEVSSTLKVLMILRPSPEPLVTAIPTDEASDSQAPVAPAPTTTTADQEWFVVREWDAKVLRLSSSGNDTHTSSVVDAASGTYAAAQRPPVARLKSNGKESRSPSTNPKLVNCSSEQAVRACIRQAIVAMDFKSERATKEEMRVLKECGILGKRAPSCMIIRGQDLILLLLKFGHEDVACELRVALREKGSRMRALDPRLLNKSRTSYHHSHGHHGHSHVNHGHHGNGLNLNQVQLLAPNSFHQALGGFNFQILSDSNLATPSLSASSSTSVSASPTPTPTPAPTSAHTSAPATSSSSSMPATASHSLPHLFSSQIPSSSSQLSLPYHHHHHSLPFTTPTSSSQLSLASSTNVPSPSSVSSSFGGNSSSHSSPLLSSSLCFPSPYLHSSSLPNSFSNSVPLTLPLAVPSASVSSHSLSQAPSSSLFSYSLSNTLGYNFPNLHAGTSPLTHSNHASSNSSSNNSNLHFQAMLPPSSLSTTCLPDLTNTNLNLAALSESLRTNPLFSASSTFTPQAWQYLPTTTPTTAPAPMMFPAFPQPLRSFTPTIITHSLNESR